MSRNLYTIATISARCEAKLRAVFASSGIDAVPAGEECLRRAVAAHEPLVAFYRVLLDGWSTAHRELCSPLRHLSFALGRCVGHLNRHGFVFIEPSELACLLSAEQVPGEQTDNPGRYAKAAMWDALREAGVFAAATGGRTIVMWANVGPSIDDAEFRA